MGAEVEQGERLEGAHCSLHLLMQLMHLSRLRMCMPFIRDSMWRTHDCIARLFCVVYSDPCYVPCNVRTSVDLHRRKGGGNESCKMWPLLSHETAAGLTTT